MKSLITVLLALCIVWFASTRVVAADATVNVSSEDVQASGNQITVHVALPGDVVGKRIDRVILEIPITVGTSADSAFIHFPLIELDQSGSEEPKQTALLTEGFDGVAHFDVTRFVQTWSTADAREFVLGALSEGNLTVLELGAAGEWEGGVKARLIVTYSILDGVSATTIGAP
jgi:hypothetical protein